MAALANYLGRQLWWSMLWLMRRPWMKNLQRGSTRMLGPARQPALEANLRSQNALARRWGLRLVTFSVGMFLASIAVTVLYFLALELYQQGLLSPPEP